MRGVGRFLLAALVVLTGCSSVTRKVPVPPPGLHVLKDDGLYAVDVQSGRATRWLAGSFAAFALASDGSVAVVTGPREIAIITAKGQKTYRVAGELARTPPSWSPDSRFLLYAAAIPDGQASPPNHIWRLDTASGEEFRVLEGIRGRDYQAPRYAPIGGLISFTGWDDGMKASAVFVAREDGESRNRVGRGTASAWSPDGSKLAVVEGDGTVRIYYIGDRPRAAGTLPEKARPGATLAWGAGDELYWDKDGGVSLGSGRTLSDSRSPQWRFGN